MKNLINFKDFVNEGLSDRLELLPKKDPILNDIIGLSYDIRDEDDGDDDACRIIYAMLSIPTISLYLRPYVTDRFFPYILEIFDKNVGPLLVNTPDINTKLFKNSPIGPKLSGEFLDLYMELQDISNNDPNNKHYHVIYMFMSIALGYLIFPEIRDLLIDKFDNIISMIHAGNLNLN